MSVRQAIEKHAKHTAVYWGSPVPDGYGGLTFDSPIEINCIWSEKKRSMMSNEGREVVSEAQVHVLQDVDQNGMLFHGKLTDLTQDQKDDPRTLERAYEILRFIKIESLVNPGEYGRVAFLSK